jgi:thiol-disulfide isomerase/thioredoxin
VNDPRGEEGARPRWSERQRRWARIVRDLVLFGALFFGIRAYQSRDAAKGMAPAVMLSAIDGRSFELGVPRAEPLLVYFWATWCGVCTAAEPNLSAVGAALPVVTVASQSGEPAALAAEVKRRGLHLPVVADPQGALARRFGVRAFPTAFVLDRAGSIRSGEVGYTTELGLRLRMWWAGR